MISPTVEIRLNRFPKLAGMTWEPAFSRMASYLHREVGEMFATAGRSRGHKWQELAPSTLIRKAKAGESTEILQRTGRGRASFRVLNMTPDELRFGSDVFYMKIHDTGSPRVPQRPLLRVIPRDVEFLGSQLVEHINRTASGGG